MRNMPFCEALFVGLSWHWDGLPTHQFQCCLQAKYIIARIPNGVSQRLLCACTLCRLFADVGSPAGCIAPETLEKALVGTTTHGSQTVVHESSTIIVFASQCQ